MKPLPQNNPCPQPSDSPAAVSVLIDRGEVSRPEGSLAARALGNTVHAFLEKLASHFAAGGTLAEAIGLPSRWSPRIAALLRSHGLSLQQTVQSAAVAQAALKGTLEDPQGQWILSAHRDALSESALQGWLNPLDADAIDPSGEEWDNAGSNGGAQPFSVRLDRVFRAGATPLSHSTDGESRVWIVDYKTAAHDRSGLDAFLDRQKEIYRHKMESYAQALRLLHGEGIAINLALYYPLLRKLVWWQG